MSEPKTYGEAVELQKRVRCFMDGIDWQHHLGADISGAVLYPDVDALRDHSKCVVSGGCGIVEVEVRLIRWVEDQNLHFRKSGEVK
jgi:hypothetical protein